MNCTVGLKFMQWSFHHTRMLYWVSIHSSKYLSCFALGKGLVKCLHGSKPAGEISWARDLDASRVMLYLYGLELEIFSWWRCKLYGNCLVMMYKPDVSYDVKCIWIWFCSTISFLGYLLKPYPFWDRGNTSIIGFITLSSNLLVLIQDFIRQNTNSETWLI